MATVRADPAFLAPPSTIFKQSNSQQAHNSLRQPLGKPQAALQAPVCATVAVASSLISTRFWGRKRQRRKATCLAAPQQIDVSVYLPGIRKYFPLAGGFNKLAEFARIFYKFLRPHTIRGTVIASLALTLRIVTDASLPVGRRLLAQTLAGVLSLLCANGYIVGVNQIYDVSIDRINKPFLPMAAGEMSTRQATLSVMAMVASGLAIAFGTFGKLIGALYTLGLALGTAYSVPPIRLRRYPVAASAIIASARGFLLNTGVFLALSQIFDLDAKWDAPIAFITLFATIFALIIAIAKDLPDTKGDVAHNITTFTSILGVETAARLVTGGLLFNYFAALAWVFLSPASFRPGILVSGHAAFITYLLHGFNSLRSAHFSTDAIKAYYALIWRLFYAEYFLFPFI